MSVSHTSICTNDSDEFRAWELAMGLEAQRTQLSRGPEVYQADIVVSREMCVWRYRESHRVLTDFALPLDAVELCVARCPETPVWCGMRIPTSIVAIHVGGKSYRTVLPAGAEVYGLVLTKSSSMARDLFSDEVIDRAGLLEQGISFAPKSILGPAIESLDTLLCGATNPLALRVAGELALSRCRELVDQCFPVRVTGALLAKKALVDDATDLIASRLSGELTVQELVAELGVSRRVLERAFRQHLGVTPLQYLFAQRLHAARRMLKDGTDSILEVCLNAGFNHPSRFAETYARHFGELPSHTKSRK